VPTLLSSFARSLTRTCCRQHVANCLRLVSGRVLAALYSFSAAREVVSQSIITAGLLLLIASTSGISSGNQEWQTYLCPGYVAIGLYVLQVLT
jgi:hypothetical protein